MEKLEERLKARKVEYDKLIKAEHLTEDFLGKITPLFPSSSNITGSVYNRCAHIYISMDSVEIFEEKIISEISEMLKIVWRRRVDKEAIAHSTDIVIEEEEFHFYLTVTSKPTDSCRIIAVPTGKTKTVSKTVLVEEQEFDYLVDCKDGDSYE